MTKSMSVVNGNADAAFVFEGARSIAAKDDPKAMTDTRYLQINSNSKRYDFRS